MQLLINILIAAALYWQIAAGYAIAYYPSRLFQLTHAIVLTSASYFMYGFQSGMGLPWGVALCLAVICSTAIGVLSEILLYSKIRKQGISSSKAMIASLGLYTVLQGLLVLIWKNETRTLSTRTEIHPAHSFSGLFITDMDLIILVVSGLMGFSYLFLMRKTGVGRRNKAVSSNPDLSLISGINKDGVIRVAYLIGSAMASITGILIALHTNMTPSLGFHWLLFGITAMIIGGVGSNAGLIWGAVIIAALQHIVGYFIGSQWMELVTFVVLIVFLIFRPLGFSGKRLKKTEI